MYRRTGWCWLLSLWPLAISGCEVFNNSCPVAEPQVWGYVSVDLDIRRAFVRQCEAPVGNLIADAMLGYTYEMAQPQVAVINAGAIRDEVKCGPSEKREFIRQGPITDQDIFQMLPFKNSIVLVQMTGSQLKDVLEWGVSALNLEGEPGTRGFFLQVAGENGIQVTVDCSRQPQTLKDDRKTIDKRGERIVSVTFGGQPLLETGSYRVATLDYLVGTGDLGVPNDGFAAFHQEGITVYDTNIPLTDVVRKWLQEGLAEHYPSVEGRLVRQNCTANCSD